MLALCCLSHSPLIGTFDPVPEIVAEVQSELDRARSFVEAFDPSLMIVFGVDHLNGFLYKVMPQFCIGLAARSMGDYGTDAGSICVDFDVAADCARAVLDSGVDVAISADMVVDHAFAQPMVALTGAVDAVPTVPVFINAAAPPRASIARSRALGSAVGRWAMERDERVLIVGSGGLSHDPPAPSLVGASPELHRRLVDGLGTEGQRHREAATVDAARLFAAGSSGLRPLAPDFDVAFQQLLADGRLDVPDTWEDDWLTERYGRAVHEIRTWVAAFAALSAAGGYRITQRYYRPIDEWIAGFGIMSAAEAHSG